MTTPEAAMTLDELLELVGTLDDSPGRNASDDHSDEQGANLDESGN